MNRDTFGNRFNTHHAAILLALGVVLTAPLTSSAQVLDAVGFTLELNEKEMMLAHPGDQGMAVYTMWDVGYQRKLDRNMPFVKLTNDDDSEGPITELRLTIGDNRFHFSDQANMFHGLYTMIGRTNPNFALTSDVDDQGDELVVTLGSNGLQPGESVIFRIKIGVDAGQPGIFPYPDYRTVMFDMNGRNIYDGNLIDFSSDDNAMATALYGTTGSPPLEVGPLAFEDTPVAAPEAFFVNQAIRPYGIMEHADTFAVSAQTSTVPEPSSIALGIVGGLGGLIVALRSRRRAARTRTAIHAEALA